MTDDAARIDAVLAKLWAWREHDFHADRQLSDEVLIADGWTVTQDASFEGGVCWSWGTNPTVCSSETTRPHPINDLNAAYGVVPSGHCVQVVVTPKSVTALVWRFGDEATNPCVGHSTGHTVAVITAALEAKRKKMVNL